MLGERGESAQHFFYTYYSEGVVSGLFTKIVSFTSIFTPSQSAVVAGLIHSELK